MDSVTLLRQLRTDYTSKKVSALVGAGFSKNALPAFPLWPDLLLPLVKETYSQEFEDLRKYYIRQAKKNGESRDECIKHACNDILLKYGNLEVVSEYIRRKGLGHEAIDAYIEQYIKPAEVVGRDWKYDKKKYESHLLQTHIDLLQCTSFHHIYTTNYDNLLETAQQLNPAVERLKVVKDEVELSDLALSRAIIKLHGDIRRTEEEEYAFDGDKNLRYIIAKEDYETYMQKHQGFSYLMRLEMLQGRFCLLGFSGSDPNYMMWLQWMKEILDKEQRHFTNRSDDADVKVYMVHPFATSISAASALFYKNHHVGVINLTDSSVIHEMQRELRISIVPASNSEVDSNKSPKELLHLFFMYLQAAQEQKKSVVDYPASTSGYADKYISYWRSIEEEIANNRDASYFVDQVEQAYDSAKTPLNTSWQEDIIYRLIHQTSPWDKETAHIFALAVRDKGNMPRYYRSVITESNRIYKDDLWKRLLLREHLFTTPKALVEEQIPVLQRIMAYAYSFDFEQMYALLEKWRPRTSDLPKKWMLLSLFNQREKFITRLDSQIKNVQDDADRMNLCVMRNIQSRDWPHRYDMRQYAKQGLKSTVDVVQSIARTIGVKKVKTKRKPYGVIVNSVSWERGNPEYEGSMRIINLLYDNAYVPCYYSISLIPAEDWYDVFSQLYEQYPFPTIYYSSYITDNYILRRIGQDLAYSEALYPILPEITKSMLLGISSKHHPLIMEQGILAISAELYIVVPEDVWYDAFKKNVFDFFCIEILPNDYVRDSWTSNIRAALKNIRSAEHVNDLFIMLMNHFATNPKVVGSLCVGYLQLENLSVKDDNVHSVITKIIKQGSLLEYSEIFYALTFYKKLTQGESVTLAKKIDNEDLSFCQHEERRLFQIAYLAQAEKQKEVIKKLILQIPDLWNSGISEKSRTETSPFPLLALPDTIRWNSDEMDKIVKNMEENLDKIVAVKLREEDFFLGSYFKLIGDMLHFMIIHRDTEYDFSSIKQTIQHVVTKLTNTTTTKELFYAQDYFVLNLGYYMLVAEMYQGYTNNVRSCIDVLITRIMMQDKSEMQTLVSMVCWVLTDFTDYLIKEYKDALLSILRVGQGFNYKDMELELASTNASCIRIAELLHKQGVRDSSVDVWLTDKMLRRFTLRIV